MPENVIANILQSRTIFAQEFFLITLRVRIHTEACEKVTSDFALGDGFLYQFQLASHVLAAIRQKWWRKKHTKFQIHIWKLICTCNP